MRRYLSVAAVLVVLSVTMACGGTSSADKTKTAGVGKPAATATNAAAPAGTAGAGTAIKVAAKDYAFTLDKNSGSAGSFTFTATNSGLTDHELVVFKTDLAPDKLPLVADQSKVDEDAAGLDHIDELEDLNVGESKTLTLELTPGAYVLVCNLPAHYKQGMYTAFTVK